jgi:hypothetical protein
VQGPPGNPDGNHAGSRTNTAVSAAGGPVAARPAPPKETQQMLFRLSVVMVAVFVVGACDAQSKNSPPAAAAASAAPAPAAPAAPAAAKAAPPAQSGGALYTVTDGNKVDDNTLQGWKTWRAMACERCHGAKQEGLVGPSLVDALKSLSKDDFHKLMMEGRPDKGMPNFGGSEMMRNNWQNLYAYLKGRSDGKIEPGHLYPADKQ